MSGIQDFLAPFSHLIFANRNIVIVLVCAVAFWAAMQALKDRWRADKLERDLNASHAAASAAPAGRRYATTMDEPAAESGGALPPIKGGRSYARNLGSALQKAGVSSPQIYSPPTPSGFTPNTNQPQPPMAQPGGAPFGAPATPWGAPAQAPTPWAFPAGAGRNPVQPPTPAPFYQPQPPVLPAPQPGPFAGQGPAFGAPNFPPPQQPAPFPNPVPASAQAPAAPPMTPLPVPPAPALPPMPSVAPTAPASAEADSNDGGRRGKPKRRRFGFNVLENLEKMVQSKPAETTGASAPVSPASPVPPTAPPSHASVPPAAPPATHEAAPAPTLPFLFGQRSEPNPPPAPAPAMEPEKAPEAAAEPETAEPETAEPETAEPETAEQTLPFSAPAEPAQAEAVSEAAPQEAKPEARRSMRSMMFGEEIAAAGGDQADEPEQAVAESEASAVSDDDAQPQTAEPAEAQTPETETTWSQPWKQREELAAEGEMAGAEQEPSTSVTPDAEPPLQPFGSYDPWKPVEPETADAAPAASEPEAWTPEAPAESEPLEVESQPEPVAAEAPAVEVEAASSEPVTDHEPVADNELAFSAGPAADTIDRTPDGPTTTESDRPSAGTLVIIEDDQTAASYYATLFEGNGYHVEVANDGVSGVDLATRVQPQVILLDVMMPRQNGILVLQTLRASDETRNTPVVVMSNFSEPTLIKRALQLGALEYVIKTQVEGPALLNALPRWINREKAFAAA